MSLEFPPHQFEYVWNVLSQQGVEKYPSRNLVVPSMSPVRISSIAGEAQAPFIHSNLILLKDFLEGDILLDKFGTDHYARRRWRDDLFIELGSGFVRVYEEKNKIKGNALDGVRLLVRGIGFRMKDSPHIDARLLLEDIYNEMQFKLHDPITSRRYSSIESLEEKIGIVDLFDDRVLEILLLFSE